MGDIDLFKMLLLEFKANPNVTTDTSPIQLAAHLGQIEMCHLLCENSETILVDTTHFGQYVSTDYRPSFLAARAGHHELSIYLQQQEQEYMTRRTKEIEEGASHFNDSDSEDDSALSWWKKNNP